MGVLVALALGAGLAVAFVLPPGGTFVDDDANIHEGNIEAIVSEDVTAGCNPPTNNRYCPSSKVSRGQMAAFLVRALDLAPTNFDYFVDDNTSIFEGDINRLAAAKITMGCNPPTNNRFCPRASVTRAQMAALLVRGFKFTSGAGANLFIDDNASIYENDIDRLGTAKVTSGCNPPTNNRFCPNGHVTRDQMASFLARAMGLKPIVPPPSCELTGSCPNQKLNWPPPSGWGNYEQLVIPASGGLIEMDPNKDYRIMAPDTIVASVELRGGRNVVWIGGHIRIAGFPSNATGVERRALTITDTSGVQNGRIVHVEGLLVNGDDLAEGINTNAPSAIIQLQNIRVELVKIKSAYDRDQLGNHPDLIQTWGSQLELRIDGFTGRSNYQGFYLREAFNHVHGTYHMRRVNVEGVETTTPVSDGGDGQAYANVRFFRSDRLGETGPWFLDGDTVWVKGHPNGFAGGDLAEIVYPPPTKVGTDSLGKYVEWPGVKLTDGTNRTFAVGRVRGGTPPGGDYVPASSVGLNYQSPGYK